MNSICLLKCKKEENVQELPVAKMVGFCERMSTSLSFRQIRQLKVFGAKRKVVLHGEVYAWTPDLRSFDKLHNVGVSSYLVLHFI